MLIKRMCFQGLNCVIRSVQAGWTAALCPLLEPYRCLVMNQSKWSLFCSTCKMCNWGWLCIYLVLLHTLLPWSSRIRALLLLIQKTGRQKQSSVCVSTSDWTVQAWAEVKAVKISITSSCPLQSSLALHFISALQRSLCIQSLGLWAANADSWDSALKIHHCQMAKMHKAVT